MSLFLRIFAHLLPRPPTWSLSKTIRKFFAGLAAPFDDPDPAKDRWSSSESTSRSREVHLFLKAGHTKTFRELEKKWPNRVACDRELDNMNERFGVQYW
jgi:hypothetical protein